MTKTIVWQPVYIFSALLAVCGCLFGGGPSVASAELITFYFEAELTRLQTGYSLPIGQKAHGRYTFELTTPPISDPEPNSTYTRYAAAVTNFTVTLDGLGTASGGAGGDIRYGNPVRTTGSYNFYSDQYIASGPDTTGISIPASFPTSGIRNLVRAKIHLQDLDQEGLHSEDLLPTPPDLAPFLDNAGLNYDSDHAKLYLTFDSPLGGYNSVVFQLTSLTARPVPEPTSLALMLMLFGPIGGLRLFRRTPLRTNRG